MEDYDLPVVDTLVGKHILKGILPDDRIGNVRIMDTHGYEEMWEQEGYDPEDSSFIVVRRRAGYLTDTSYTDISGIEVQVWAKTRPEADRLMSEVTKRLLAAEGNTFDGFLVDFVVVLNGPEEQYPPMMDDRSLEKAFEMHIRVRWH